MRLEVHILQNFAPSNLNRDDTGSPKDADFGGHRRARISSQCIKRSMRKYFQDQELLPEAALADRTKRLAKAVAELLVKKGRAEPAATIAAQAGVNAFLAKSEAKDGDHKTPYLLFLGQTEIARFADLVDKNWDAFSTPPAAEVPVEGKKTKGKKAKDEGPKAPEGFDKAVLKLLDGGKAADLALFGRMLADLPETNIDAACQVAHALSTNKIHTMEMDYYTAVDDLKPNDNAGADMIGTVEFNSACYYRYANLDLGQLDTNLQKDAELLRKTVEAFLKASVHAIPTGKQNSFAAQNLPSLVMITVRQGPPMSLANAFVNPVRPTDKGDLVSNSIAALDEHYGAMQAMYGTDAKVTALCVLGKTTLTALAAHQKKSVAEVIQAALAVLPKETP
jgi:CRISPR system Cascade subunit CasC